MGLAVAGVGVAFFVGGTVGVLRFPDVHSRLHALTKADNVGMGLVSLGLALYAGSPGVAAKLLLIWLIVLVASAANAFSIANKAPHGHIDAEERRGD